MGENPVCVCSAAKVACYFATHSPQHDPRSHPERNSHQQRQSLQVLFASFGGKDPGIEGQVGLKSQKGARNYSGTGRGLSPTLILRVGLIEASYTKISTCPTPGQEL